MTLRHTRFCNECDKEIPRDADFIGTEGIYIEGKGREELKVGIELILEAGVNESSEQ